MQPNKYSSDRIVDAYIARPSRMKMPKSGMRFCETCQRYVSYPHKLAIGSGIRKGWKCPDCKGKENG